MHIVQKLKQVVRQILFQKLVENKNIAFIKSCVILHTSIDLNTILKASDTKY